MPAAASRSCWSRSERATTELGGCSLRARTRVGRLAAAACGARGGQARRAIEAEHARRVARDRRLFDRERRHGGRRRGIRAAHQGVDSGPEAIDGRIGPGRGQDIAGRSTPPSASQAIPDRCGRHSNAGGSRGASRPQCQRRDPARALPGARAEFRSGTSPIRHRAATAKQIGGGAAAARPVGEASIPRNSTYRNLKAVVLAKIGEYRESIKLYEEVLAAHPEHPRIWLSYGHALATAGREQDSMAAYRKSIRLAPDLGEAYWSLANLKTFRFTAPEKQAMQTQLARIRLERGGALPFRFRDGQGTRGRTPIMPKSFAHYQLANQLRHRARQLRRATRWPNSCGGPRRCSPPSSLRGAKGSASARPIRSSSSACRAPDRP